MARLKGLNSLGKIITISLSICFLLLNQVAAQQKAKVTDEFQDEEPATKPVVKPTQPTKPIIKPSTKPIIIDRRKNPRTPNDPSFPSDETADLDKLIEQRDQSETIEQLKGELPCLDSSASCITQLQSLAVKNNSGLKQLDIQIEGAESAIKIANSGGGNIFRQAQILKPLIGTAFFGPLGGLVGFIDQLANNSRTDETTNQANADLVIKVAQFQRTKVEVAENLKLSVLNELIRFDEVRADAELSSVLAIRESSRLRLIEVAYRLGESTTEGYLSLQNSADRNKAAASAKRSTMRSQAEKVKRIVISGADT